MALSLTIVAVDVDAAEVHIRSTLCVALHPHVLPCRVALCCHRVGGTNTSDWAPAVGARGSICVGADLHLHTLEVSSNTAFHLHITHNVIAL